jgi:hypothetical protein
MLKELSIIARGLLGLHGFPVDAPQRGGPAVATATPARTGGRPVKATRVEAPRAALRPAQGAR